MQLTKDQNKAVLYNKGPLLIVAGAGTGKTLVLVEKVKYLLKKRLAQTQEILLLTFTDKAAGEMEERVDRALPYGYFQMNISTFHSFCDKILREEASHIGISPAYKLHNKTESIIFLRDNLFNFELDYFRPMGNPNKFIEGLMAHFSRLSDEDISPKQYLAWVKKNKKQSKINNQQSDEYKKNLELSRAFEKYQNLKIKNNVMDFSDLNTYTLKLFRKRPNILKKYQQQFKYILVDEFQDTNFAQYELLKLLAPTSKKTKLTVVGDDSQSIYKFRGASVSNIMQFMKDYKMANQVVLTDNFRSSQIILDSAYKLIRHNDPDTLEVKLNISKNLKSMTGQGKENDINLKILNRDQEEADYIASEIEKLITSDGYSPQQIAVLTRANNHNKPIARALSQKAIPYQFAGPGMLLARPEVKELISFLKIITDINDSAALFRVLTMSIFKIDLEDIVKLMSFAKKVNLPLYEAIQITLSAEESSENQKIKIYRQHVPIISDLSLKKIDQVNSIIKKCISKIARESGGEILFTFLESSGLLKLMANVKSKKQEKITLNIAKFFDRIRAFEMSHEDISVLALIDYIDMTMQIGDSPQAATEDVLAENAVHLLTVHSAKGLEFPVVFVANMVDGRFPTYHRKEQIPIPESLIKEILPQGNFHLQEERRLFYVAVTRAQKKLYLTTSRFYGEGLRERKISKFIYEALGEEIVREQSAKKTMEKKQLSIFDFKKKTEKSVYLYPSSTNFSYSQLQTFQTCPLRYKYQYVLNIPTTPTAAASFGSTIHKTLQDLYKKLQTNEVMTTKELIDKMYDNWIPLGYTSKKFEQKMKKNGESMLAKFYNEFFDKKTKILDLEKWFKIKINNISISGKIDRVDLLKKNKIEIIDYKTGKPKAEKDAAKDLQLNIYALAATEPALYNKKITDITLTYYYLQNNQKKTFEVSRANLTASRKQIEKIAGEIAKEKFDPKVGPWCSFCPFKINCEAWQ